MNRIHNHIHDLNVISKLADLKEEHYKNVLVLGALLELLIEKGIINTKEIEEKLTNLDAASFTDPFLD